MFVRELDVAKEFVTSLMRRRLREFFWEICGNEEELVGNGKNFLALILRGFIKNL